MGMSGLVLDNEERFYDIVADAVKQSEHITEAYATVMQSKSLVAHLSNEEICSCVDDFWDDFWSRYGC